ncbi:unnamed protein product [Chrysodeixis includens]|uniref:Uncharacterized protein n=1 Tax=Chrysodeixis includens TaxID=689277 RepID=A0A9P0BLX3_CHRIL|nr:unnamed protein product [Chrysodeixis includens]
MNPSINVAGTANTTKTIILNALKKLSDAIEKGNFEDVVQNVDLLHSYISLDKNMLANLHNVGEQYNTQLDLIISACLHKRADILYYLLHETDILEYMPETGLSEEQLNQKRKKAMSYAICSNDYNIPEMLYDYWCGDTHWSGHKDADYVVNTMATLGLLLKDAKALCEGRLIQEQKMLTDVHCLIKFNEFQCKLYSVVQKLKNKFNPAIGIKNEGKVVGTLLYKVLRTYDYYSNIDKVRIKNSILEIDLENQASIQDKDSIFGKVLAYTMYELYFRKLDLNVSLIILENLTVLRNHLKKRFTINNKQTKPNTRSVQYTRLAKLYEDIESELYHFVYRIKEDWRLYLSPNRQLAVKENRLGIHNGQFCTLNLRYDEEKIYNSSVLYLERKKFKKHLKYLKRILIKHVICKSPPNLTTNQATQGKEKIEELLDNNYLKPMHYLRDNYSLQKVCHYIKVVLNNQGLNVLMIERTLQVIGEMMKSTTESEHVSKTTEALLQIDLSNETLQHLRNIRLYLSKVEQDQLSRRILVTNSHDLTFNNVQKDLQKMLDSIKSILNIYKYILDKSFVDKGDDLLNDRIFQLPCEASLQNDIIDRYHKDGSDFEKKYYQDVWQYTGLSRDLLQEIPFVYENKDRLLQLRVLFIELIAENAMVILPKHIQNIRQALPNLADNYNNIQEVNKDLKRFKKIKELPDWPSRQNIKDRLGKLKKYMKDANDQILLDKLDLIQDLTDHWSNIQHALMFFLYEIDRFSAQRVEFDKNVKNSNPDQPTVEIVHKILDEMERSCGTSQQPAVHNHKFDGIEDLDTNVYIAIDISKDTSRSIRDKWIKCLITRIDQLTDLLDYPNRTLSQCQLRFKRDQTFHVVLEMLLADIANVLSKCRVCLMKKTGKMLTGIDLGNVLDHGNPFLDVISDVFDSRDFSTELLKKAFMFAKDGDAIKALYKLFSENVSHETIKRDDRRTLTDDQKKNLDVLKQSENFDILIKLCYVKT